MKKKICLSVLFLIFMFGTISVSAASVDDLEYEIADGIVVITDCNSEASGRLVIPSTIEGCYVRRIEDFAFKRCANITAVEVPNTVNYIGEGAFERCTSLKDIKLPDKKMHIGFSAFSGTDFANDEANYEDGLLYIGKHLVDWDLNNMDDLPSHLTIKSGTLTISEWFACCTTVQSISIPASVSYISSYAFEECLELKLVYIEDLSAWCKIVFEDHYEEGFNYLANPLYNGADLYLNGELVTHLVIPEGVSTIKPYAFYGCGSIKEITLPESITEIGQDAFENLINLTTVYAPRNMELIDVRRLYYFGSNVSIEYAMTYYVVRYRGDYTGLERVLPGEDACGIAFEDGMYEFTTYDGLPWDGKNITSDVVVIVRIREHRVYFQGYYEGEQWIKYGNNAELPEPPNGCTYTFVVLGDEWDGQNVTGPVDVFVELNVIETDISDTSCQESDGVCNYTAVLRAAEQTEAYLVVAVYDESEKMIGMDVQKVNLENSEYTASGSVNINGIPADYKVFLWSDLNNLIPLPDSAGASIQ